MKQISSHAARLIAFLIIIITCCSPLPAHSFVVSPAALSRPNIRPKISSSNNNNIQLFMVRRPSSLLPEDLPSSSVIQAVEQRAGQPVLASDVASMAGVSLQQSKKDLTLLASLTQGDIAVSKDGDLIYSFPQNIQSVLTERSVQYKAVQTFEKIWPTLFWGIRVSFGVALIASLVAIFSTIFFISTASSSSDNDNRRDNRSSGGGMRLGGGFNYWFGPSPFDVFYYRPYGYYGVYGRGGQVSDPDEMGFLESIFSYIFGDGDPNQQLEQRRLQLAAQMIRENKGAVTAEQLAPFCDDLPEPASQQEAVYVDESFVLPIVAALNGEPQVTEEGEIVYVFPDLQVSAAASATSLQSTSRISSEVMTLKRAGLSPKASNRDIQRLLEYNGVSTRGILERADLLALLEPLLPPMTASERAAVAEADPSVLQEQELQFSVATDLNKFLAGGLGVVNLGGALYLGNLFSQAALYSIKLPGIYGAVQALYPLLLGYAVLFNAIPLARNFYIKRENDKIRQRNERRRSWKTALQSGMGNARSRIGAKLQAANRYKSKIKQLGSNLRDVIYDTRQSVEVVERKREEDALKAFDQMLETSNNDATDNSNTFQ